ncbi:hypothetical protein GCM10011351_17930 [Paraliobacillus quinghaiensis]|uniref:Uncharacterized protein n=1 Tax=Paraliobacillus quinghaiensis TaxID=470815 RepID=A0A917TPN9_9BACI|nr:hypothetical protein [Paraliobacillus quinghaiensis]GGM32230.1 hypothetical protein GCM10011351_17930 [Paraliobacillus quinghaiensis]
MKDTNATDSDKLKALLSNVYQKGSQGASLQEVMHQLQAELPRILKRT